MLLNVNVCQELSGKDHTRQEGLCVNDVLRMVGDGLRVG